MKKRFSEEQVIGFLRETEAGVPVKELSRKHDVIHPVLADRMTPDHFPAAAFGTLPEFKTCARHTAV